MKFTATGMAIVLALATSSVALAQGGDPEAGEKVFRKCKTCHTLEEGTHRVGPSLYGIFGRTAGTAEGFSGYSSAMEESGIVWDETTLSDYLVDPKAYVPGTKMVFAGLPDEEDRINLITYLESATQ